MKHCRGSALIAAFALFGAIVALSGSSPADAGQFPGTNGKIAYTKVQGGCECWNVWVINADGTGDTKLTVEAPPPALPWVAEPSWSPDGTQIAYTNYDNGDIYVMNANGSNPHKITTSGFNSLASWSPDGAHIVFESGRDGDQEIFVMNADGTGQTPLTANEFIADTDAQWSPDGVHIAFKSDRDGHEEIYVMNADGTNQTRLTNRAISDLSPDLPSWSPDGTHIAFSAYGVVDFTTRIFVMDANGSNQIPLTSGDARDYFPSWSPDGVHITFTSVRDGHDEIYVMNADGTGQTRVTTTVDGTSWGSAWQSIPIVVPTTTTTVAPTTTAVPADVAAVTATPAFTG